MNGYRKELKYIVGDDVILDVRNRIDGLMKKDRHQTGDFYKIRSIYCDSPSYRCYRENLAGVSTREKYRIRTYDTNSDLIHAEIKIRHRETISKMSADIDRDLFDALISEDTLKAADALKAKLDAMDISKMEVSNGTVSLPGTDINRDLERRALEKYLARFGAENFRPAVIVDYERSAYVYDTCNVRITFDRNVFASREFDRMFDPNLTGRPALDGNLHILEIKYDEFLPDEIKDVLSGVKLERTSSSKYAKCLARFL